MVILAGVVHTFLILRILYLLSLGQHLLNDKLKVCFMPIAYTLWLRPNVSIDNLAHFLLIIMCDFVNSKNEIHQYTKILKL